MNFYAIQDSAKKKTKYLILVYLLILLALTLFSSLVLLYLVPIAIGQPIPNFNLQSIFSEQHLPMFVGVGLFIVGGAFISSYVKSRHLAKGGAVIAASLGGVKISPNSTDLSQRKVLNVVEEMAIASGMPVPEVFLLQAENDINAFAAGQTPMDAVIGVTQGCIDKLSRAQLQGVIGHEFSHILNGDMRLNLRIIMMLHGIEFIGLLGRILTSGQRRSRYGRGRSNGKGSGVIVLAGIALRIIGWFGVLFGNLIQAAVSRQREFLADASAVQFTRDPSSIADALKVIGGRSTGSRIRNTDVNEVAHMFFAQSFNTRFSLLFATHPPIVERIKTLEPHWDGEFLAPREAPLRETISSEKQTSEDLQSFSNLSQLPEPLALLVSAGVVLEQLNAQQQSQLNLLLNKSHDPMEAMALILAVFIIGEGQLSKSTSNSSKQQAEQWQEWFLASEIEGLETLVKNRVETINKSEVFNHSQVLLPLVELSMPALKEMSLAQYEKFKTLLEHLILWDGEKSVFEQSLFLLITRYLDVHFNLRKVNKIKYRKASQVIMELQLVFSCLIHFGHEADKVSNFTMQQAYKRTMQHLGFFEQTLLELDSFSSDQNQLDLMFKQAVEKLVHCSLPLKQKIVEALSITIEFDGEVNQVEKELILAIAATMDAPLPRVKLLVS